MNLEQIKKLLEGITQGEWSVWDENKHFILSGQTTIAESYSKWGYAPRNPEERIPSQKEGESNADFIAAAPSIVRFLLERVEDLERQGIADMKEVTELSEKVKDIELRYQAARNVAIRLYAKQFTVKKEGGSIEADFIDEEIQAEVERLKDNG